MNSTGSPNSSATRAARSHTRFIAGHQPLWYAVTVTRSGSPMGTGFCVTHRGGRASSVNGFQTSSEPRRRSAVRYPCFLNHDDRIQNGI